MKNSGCHGNQGTKPFKIFSKTTNWISIIILQEWALGRGYRIPLKKRKKLFVKKHGFYGRLNFPFLWYRVKLC